jgi:hypothetical protein
MKEEGRRTSGGKHVALTERNFSMWHIFISQGPRETKYINYTISLYTYPEDTYIMASTSALSNSKVSELQQSGDFSIKSESVTPKLGSFTVN